MINLFKEWLDNHFSDPQMIILGFLLILGFIFIFYLGQMLAPMLASIVIAYLLDGMVNTLQRLKIPRLAAVMIVFLFFLASLFFIIIGLLPLISQQIGQLIQQFPVMVNAIQTQLILLPQKYPDFISTAQIRTILGFITSEFTGLAQKVLSLSLASVKQFIMVVVYLILVPLLVFFFLKDKALIIDWITGFLPEHRGLATEVWRDVNIQISNYVRGKVWEIIIIWGVTYATFSYLEMEYSMLLGLFTGLSVLIPYIGATVMLFPVVLIAFFQWGIGSEFAYGVMAYAIIQALDGNLLAPILLSGVVNLHPVAVIAAVLVFGGLWGIWGLFFAIPLATLFHAVIKAWFNHYRSGHVMNTDEIKTSDETVEAHPPVDSSAH
ncbi:MAG: AI-2E family transporter [Desulfobacterales bacterium]